VPSFSHAPRKNLETWDYKRNFRRLGKNHILARIKTPRLSILLSTKNHAEWLNQCLDCICRQSFKDFEFLICNDGSTDKTLQILKTWKNRDQRIQVFSRRRSLGVMRSYDILLKQAKGEFIWMTASDDFCHDSYFLESGFRGLSKNPSLAGFFSNCRRIIASSGDWDGFWGWSGLPQKIYSELALNEFLCGKLEICGASCVVKRNVFLKMGGYHKSVGSLCDLLSATEIAIHHGLWFIGRCSITMRVFPAGQSHGTKADRRETIRNWAAFEKHLNKALHFNTSLRKWIYWRATKISDSIRGTDKNNRPDMNRATYWAFLYKRLLFLKSPNTFDVPTHARHIYALCNPTWFSCFISRFKRSLLKRVDSLTFFFQPTSENNRRGFF